MEDSVRRSRGWRRSTTSGLAETDATLTQSNAMRIQPVLLGPSRISDRGGRALLGGRRSRASPTPTPGRSLLP